MTKLYREPYLSALCLIDYFVVADGETRNRNPLDYKHSALAIELYSSKAIAGKELNLSSWCTASLYIYHFSTVIDFSYDKYITMQYTNWINSTPSQQ